MNRFSLSFINRAIVTFAFAMVAVSAVPSTADAAACFNLDFSSMPAIVAVGEVSAPFTIRAEDSNTSCSISTEAARVVTLSDGVANGTFYSDAAGTNAITSVTLNNGLSDTTHTATFYYKDTTGGTRTISPNAPFDSSDPSHSLFVGVNPDISVTLNGGTAWTLPTPSTNGAAVTVSTGGSTVSVSITVSQLNGDDWRTTCWWFGEPSNSIRNEVNTADHEDAGTFTETFSITAPSGVSTNDLNIRIRPNQTGSNDCGTNASEMITMTGAVIVGQLSQTITVTTNAPASATYDGTFPVAATASSGLTVAITVEGGCSIDSGTVTMTSGTTDCVVKYNQAGNASYNAAPEVTETVDAQKANATINVTGFSGVYDGAQHGASGTATGVNAEDLSPSLNLGATFKNVPGGTANWTFTGDANYNDDSGTAAITITKQDINVWLVASDDFSNKVYDGTVNTQANPQYIVFITDNVFVSYASATFADADVGTEKLVTVTGIQLTGTDIGNYNLLNTEATTNADIAPITLTVTGIIANDKPFDGTTAATLDFSNALLATAVGGDEVGLGAYTADFDTAATGVDKPVTVSALALIGADAGNYTLTLPTGLTADVTSATLVASVTADDKTYDGTTAATASCSLAGVVVGHDVSCSASSAAFDDANVGTDKNVTVSGITLSGADAGGYSVNETASATADITAREITVTADAKSKAFGATDPELTYVATGELVAPDAFTGTLTRAAGEDVGTHAITQGDLALTSNYAITFTGADLTITPADGEIALSGLEHTYDGAAKQATVTSTFAYDVTYDGLADLPVNAGEYAVVATITDANHSGSANDTLTIAPAAVEVTIDNTSKAFGAVDPEFTYTVTGGTFVGEDTFTNATLSRDAGEALGMYAITGEFEAGDNYLVTVIDGTLTISNDPNNAAPTADDQNLTIEQDSSTPVSLVANDPESTPVTWNVGEPASGSLSGEAPNLTYTPDSGFFGEDSFTFSVNDGNSDSVNATVNITVQKLATCLPGFDLIGSECVANGPIEACETGYDYNGENCVPQTQDPFCAEGTLENGMCVFEGEPVGVPTCPEGGDFVGDGTDQCMIVGPIDPFNPEGEPPVTFYNPVCEEGTFDPDDDRCETIPDPISACPENFTFENGECVSDAAPMAPACPSGTTGTVVGGECTPDNMSPSCPSGYERDGRICIALEIVEPLECEDGFHVEGDQCVADEAEAEEENDDTDENAGSNNNSNSNSGGGGGGGGSYTPPANPQVLGAATSCYQFTRYLARGMSGDDVMELQKILILKGYMTVAANGHFGPATEAGVKAYQKANGLEQVGAVGPLTRALLNKCGGVTNPNQALIDELVKKLNALLEQIKALQAAQGN